MTAFEQGYAAHLAGKGIKENPFDGETSPNSRKRWDAGWARRAQNTRRNTQQ